MDRLEPFQSFDKFWRATHCLTAGASTPANTAVNTAAAAAAFGRFHKLAWEVIVLKLNPPSLWWWMFGCWSSSLHWSEVSCPAVCIFGPWLVSLGTPRTTASLQPAALANYCNLMSWPCLFEPACRYEAANTALRWYILDVRFISVQTLLMLFVNVCTGINYDWVCLVVAKLFVIWQVHYEASMLFVYSVEIWILIYEF